jgi:hypothetical protein
VTIDDGTIVGPRIHFVLNGEASLLEKKYSVSSSAVAPENSEAGTATIPTSLVGTWGGPFHVLDADTGIGRKWPSPTSTVEFFP